MKIWRLLSLSFVILGLAASAYAQRGACCGGGGNYDPATETTLTGTVDEVKNVPAPGKGPGGLHLVLATQTGPMDVHVGPASFVTAKKVAFAKGDAITVIGSKVTLQAEEVVIAREIKKGDQVLALRDANGFPLWSGRGATR